LTAFNPVPLSDGLSRQKNVKWGHLYAVHHPAWNWFWQCAALLWLATAEG